MPRFYQEVEAEIDINIDEFVSECSPKEIKNLIDTLKGDGYLTSSNIVPDNASYMEEKHIYYCGKLSDSYLQMSSEDMEIVEKLAKKYGAY
jgi:hypothetical protein